MAVIGARGDGGLLIIERILRDRDSIWRQIAEERDLNRLTGQMLASSAIALACYGAVLGASHSFLQAVVSAVKLPLLFLLTLAICLPTLYLFNLVFGARLQVRQAVALVMVTITVTAVLTLAFAPISLFFLITANHYSFFKILNVAILTLTAFVGLNFLTRGMAALNRHTSERADTSDSADAAEALRAVTADDGGDAAPVSPAPAPAPAIAALPAPSGGAVVPVHAPVHRPAPAVLLPNGQQGHPQPQLLMRPQPVRVAAPVEKPASMGLLYVWILLFGFVGTQLAWTLRPFFGHPDRPFEIFREIDGNFYVDIIRTLGNLF
jgi:hypothetical protein